MGTLAHSCERLKSCFVVSFFFIIITMLQLGRSKKQEASEPQQRKTEMSKPTWETHREKMASFWPLLVLVSWTVQIQMGTGQEEGGAHLLLGCNLQRFIKWPPNELASNGPPSWQNGQSLGMASLRPAKLTEKVWPQTGGTKSRGEHQGGLIAPL